MQTYLYFHKENIALPHPEHQGKYTLKYFDYGLSRNVGQQDSRTTTKLIL